MAITGVLRPGFIQLRVLNLDEALAHYADHVGLNRVSKEPDGRVYLKGWDEFDRHSVVLRQDATPGMDVMGFKVATDADLDSFEARVAAWGIDVERIAAGEQPGVGRRLSFIVPSGHRIELYADMALSDNHPPVQNPEIWSEMPHGMKVTRFDHALLYGPKVEETQEFFAQVLDFECAERVVTPEGLLGTWMTCSNKAHDIAIVKHDEPGAFHHAAFHLESWHDVGQAADIMARYGISIDIGPTRHGITRGQTIYFFDPSGNRNEVFAGGYSYYPDNPTREWSGDQIGKGIFYYEQQLNERFLTVVT